MNNDNTQDRRSTPSDSARSGEGSREQFEAAIRALNDDPAMLERWPAGHYKHAGVEGRWQGWQMVASAQASPAVAAEAVKQACELAARELLATAFYMGAKSGYHYNQEVEGFAKTIFQKIEPLFAAAALSHQAAAPEADAGPDEWTRGYFCAVSVALREYGDTTAVRSMYRQGGDVTKADQPDIELFIEHGLLDRAAMAAPKKGAE